VCLALLAAMVWSGVATAQEDLLGEIRTIDDVKFEGRDRVGSGELKSVIKTRQSSMWPWREREVLRPDFLRSDTLAIRDRYRHHGFLDAHVDLRVDPKRDSSRVVVTFLIHEGPQSKVVSVGLVGVKNHPEDQLRDKLLAKPGRPFDPYVLQLDTLKISELYQGKGLPASRGRLGAARRGRRFTSRPRRILGRGGIAVPGRRGLPARQRDGAREPHPPRARAQEG
jgi:hypothetical protein